MTSYILQPEQTKTVQFNGPLRLACGRELEPYELKYETYGTLNSNKSNAILICHALSSDHHVCGKYNESDYRAGWWDHYVGPGKAIDTNKFFIVCANNIGGCNGSTGPTSINPASGTYWGSDFPRIRCRDWVNTQYELMQWLNINTWAAVIGASLGGMQAQRWSLEYPQLVRHCIIIASSMKLSAQNIAFNNIARQAILNDPDYHNGQYLEHNVAPKQGLSVARMVGHVTYISDDTMSDKFGRELRTGSFQQGVDEDIEFQIESYLRYQGENFSDKFDANTYLLMTRALEYFDLAREYNNDPINAFSQASCRYLVISFSSDWRFSPQRSRDMVYAMLSAQRPCSYLEIQSDFGHDSFLLPSERFESALSSYMNNVSEES
jgi:homoserine O-acetyltransferase/O-succinyltransferase